MSAPLVAAALACGAHAGQVDKSGRPYIEHPAEVARLCEGLGAVYEEVAWLHDILEDTPVRTYNLLELGFSVEVVEAVIAITHYKHETNEEYYARCAGNEIAREVKLMDIHHNTRPDRMALLEPAVRKRLTEKYARAREALGALVSRPETP